MSLYGFWMRKEPSMTQVRNWWDDPKCAQLLTGEGVFRLMCTYTLTLLHNLEDLGS